MIVGCKKLRSGWQMSQQRCVRTTTRKCGQRYSTGQKSLLPSSGGMLRTSFTQRTSEKFQQRSLLSLLLPFLPLSSPLPYRPFFLLLESTKGLARLVTKARRLRWPRARRLARMVLDPRTRARVKRLSPQQRPRVPRLLSRSRMLSPRPRMLSPSPKQLIPSSRQLIPKMTIPEPRHSFRIFFLYFSLFLFSLYFSLFSLLWQFATVYNVPLLFCLIK